MKIKLNFNIIKNKNIPYGRYAYRKNKSNSSNKHTIYINKRLFTNKNINKFIDVAYHEYTHYILNLLLRNNLMFWNEENLTEPICKSVEAKIKTVYDSILGAK